MTDEPTRAGARHTDPSTSHDAADRVSRTGYEKQCYDFLCAHWPRRFSSFEVSERTGIHLSAVTPRWVKLERDKGLVERSQDIRPNSIGIPRRVTVWNAINPNAPWFPHDLPKVTS